MKFALRSLPRNFVQVFAVRCLHWHLLAAVATALLVYSGLDWQYFLATEHLYPYFFWTAAVGGLLPLLLPLCLVGSGYVRKNAASTAAGWMFAQAAALGWIVSSFYKVFTGRVQPNLHDYARDISHGFQFGFLRHGIFWGWPSSHTAVAFSMAFAFLTFYPQRRFASILWVIYALLIGIGVSMSIHWLSDAVAGALIGGVCGVVVGRAYVKRGNAGLSRH